MKEQWYTITGEVDANLAHNLISFINQQLYSTDINKLKIIISSSGGDMDSAIIIYHYIKALPIDVEMIAFGQIDSSANMIYSAGKRRIAINGCRFLLHEGTYTTGSPTTSIHKHEETLEIFKKLAEKQSTILANETGQTLEEINRLMQNSTILSTEEAKEIGLVHEILEKLPLSKQTV